MNLNIAFCTLVGVGGATMSSIRLGQKDQTGAEYILGNVAVLCVINAVVFSGITLLFWKRYYASSEPATLPFPTPTTSCRSFC